MKNNFGKFTKTKKREEARAKAQNELATKIKKEPKLAKPKKEFHRQFRRLINIYTDLSKKVTPTNLMEIKEAKLKILKFLPRNLDKAYKFVFVHIKQLAFTFYTAQSENKKLSFYSIYNWQFICCLDLWTDFICQNAKNHEHIASLASPLVMIICGVFKLNKSTRFIPLKLHCMRFLNQFCLSLGMTMPVLSCVIEILNCVDFNRKNKKSVDKTMNLMTMLHFSTSQMATFEFLEIIIYQLYQIIVENVNANCKNVNFPNYVVLIYSQLKKFVKKCKVSMFSNDVKILLKKIDGHSKFIALENHKNPAKIDDYPADETWNKFVTKYMSTRIFEMERMMTATLHLNFNAPDEDINERQRTQDDEDNELNMDDNEDEEDDEMENVDLDEEISDIDEDPSEDPSVDMESFNDE